MVDKRVRLAVRHPWRPMKAIIGFTCRGGLVTGRRRSAVGNHGLFVFSELVTGYLLFNSLYFIQILRHCAALLLSRSLLEIIVDEALRCTTVQRLVRQRCAFRSCNGLE